MVTSLIPVILDRLARSKWHFLLSLVIMCLACGVYMEQDSFGGRGFNETVSREKVLIKDLLDRYAKYGRVGRPLANTSDYIGVRFALSLIQVINLDEKDQVLTISVWFQYKWKDVLLKWDPKHYDNIQDVRVPSNKIWIPDIVLYNFADTRLKEQRETLVVLDYNGTTLWMPQAILKSTCSIDIKYFPFDSQTCTLKFGSWTYSGNKLDLRFDGTEEFQMADYMPSHEWDIFRFSAVRNRVDYDCCPDYYLDLTYTLSMKRKVAFYSFILVLPCALLSLLTLVIFWVPPESPAKLQLGMNIFVAFFVLLLLLAESTPRAASSIPLIGAYYCLNMIMITVSTILACVGANMFFRGVRRNRAPRWLRVMMIDGVAKVLRLRKDLIDVTEESSKKWSLRVLNDGKNRFNNHEVKIAKIRLLDTPNGKDNTDKMSTVHEVLETGRCSDFNPGTDEAKTAVLDELKTIRQMLERVREQRVRREEQERYLREWRVITCITDRLFFIIYVVCYIMSILLIFFKGSN